MTDNAPTLGEVMRRLDDIVRRVDACSHQLTEASAKNEKTYVRIDVFEARQAADAVHMNGLETEVHSISKRMEDNENRRRTDRALVFSALIAPILVALVTAALLAR